MILEYPYLFHLLEEDEFVYFCNCSPCLKNNFKILHYSKVLTQLKHLVWFDAASSPVMQTISG